MCSPDLHHQPPCRLITYWVNRFSVMKSLLSTEMQNCTTCGIREDFVTGKEEENKRLSHNNWLSVVVATDLQSPVTAEGQFWEPVENRSWMKMPHLACDVIVMHMSHVTTLTAYISLKQTYKHAQIPRFNSRYTLRMCICFLSLFQFIFSSPQQISSFVHVKMSLWCNNNPFGHSQVFIILCALTVKLLSVLSFNPAL